MSTKDKEAMFFDHFKLNKEDEMKKNLNENSEKCHGSSHGSFEELEEDINSDNDNGTCTLTDFMYTSKEGHTISK